MTHILVTVLTGNQPIGKADIRSAFIIVSNTKHDLQSCTKIAMDFVSPESIGQCINLTNEFRQLPKNHRAKEDKLEVNTCLK